MRFKSVSKDWQSLICSRYFNNRFLTIPSRPPPRLHMCLVDRNESVTLSLAPDTAATQSFSCVVNNNLTIPQIGCSPNMQSIRGIMCYTYRGKPGIYNPTTRQLLTLPVSIESSNTVYAPGHHLKFVAYYFGHDPVSNHYIVVCVIAVCRRDLGEIKLEHQILVLKRGGGGSWRKGAPTPPDFLPHIPSQAKVRIDEILYYLAWTGVHKCVLVSFNFRTLDFNMIQVPRTDGDERPGWVRNASIIEYDGRVTMIDQTHFSDKGMLDLWVVEDSLKKWSKKTLVLPPSQLHLVNINTTFNVKGTTQIGKIFLIPKHLISPFYVLCYDLQNNDLRKIEIKGVPEHWLSKDGSTVNVTLMDMSETLEFLET